MNSVIVQIATQAHNLKHIHTVTVLNSLTQFPAKVKLLRLPPFGSQIELQLTRAGSTEGFWQTAAKTGKNIHWK